MGQGMAAEIAARLIGAFYAFGGVMVIRALTMDNLLDRALAAIEGKRPPVNNSLKHWVGGAVGVLTGASGAALALLHGAAVPLFVSCLALQAGWHLAGPHLLADDDQADALGRSRTRNAMVLYALAAAFVFYLWQAGSLSAWDDPLGLAVLGVALALTAWLVSGLRSAGSNAPPRPSIDPIANAYLMPGAPARILLDPRLGETPLHDADSLADIDHFAMLSGNLAEQVEIWDGDYRRWFNVKIDEEDYDYVVGQIRLRGEAIAAALRGLLGPENVEGPVYDELFPGAD